MTDALDRNTEAALLLCGRFDATPSDEPRPLTPGEFSRLVEWLAKQKLKITDLLEFTTFDDVEEIDLKAERVQALLDRGMSLALAVERWTSSGIWVIARCGPGYPGRLGEKLATQAPVLLYGIGPQNLLEGGGIAVVGSRDVDEAGTAFTERLASNAAGADLALISGDAKGVDQIAMQTALEHGGHVVGVLADGLSQRMGYTPYREAIRDDRLTLISPFGPQVSFNAGLRMARNKFIYTLADWAFVVSSGAEQGGTWTGATENLKQRWTPLLVRDGDVPEGNRMLIERGATPLHDDAITDTETLMAALAEATQRHHEVNAETNRAESLMTPGEPGPADAIYEAFWEQIEPFLREPRAEPEIRAFFDDEIAVGQLRAWLQRASAEGRLERRTSPRVRYVVPDDRSGTRQLELKFDE